MVVASVLSNLQVKTDSFQRTATTFNQKSVTRNVDFDLEAESLDFHHVVLIPNWKSTFWGIPP